MKAWLGEHWSVVALFVPMVVAVIWRAATVESRLDTIEKSLDMVVEILTRSITLDCGPKSK